MFRKSNDETSIWISNTDLMSGLLVLFLFIAIAININLKSVQEKVDNVAKAEYNISSTMEKNFSSGEKTKYNINYNGPGSAKFDERVAFDVGSSEIKPEFKKELAIFLPKYIISLKEHCENDIEEIRIEGHTSSEWSSNVSDNAAYIYNMQLSQDRTRAILQYAFSLPELIPYHDFMRKRITANGLSSSRPIMTDGQEDKVASRRIEFKVVGNKSEIEQAIKKAGKNK